MLQEALWSVYNSFGTVKQFLNRNSVWWELTTFSLTINGSSWRSLDLRMEQITGRRVGKPTMRTASFAVAHTLGSSEDTSKMEVTKSPVLLLTFMTSHLYKFTSRSILAKVGTTDWRPWQTFSTDPPIITSFQGTMKLRAMLSTPKANRRGPKRSPCKSLTQVKKTILSNYRVCLSQVTTLFYVIISTP